MTGALNIYKASSYKIRNRNRAKYICVQYSQEPAQDRYLPQAVVLGRSVGKGLRLQTLARQEHKNGNRLHNGRLPAYNVFVVPQCCFLLNFPLRSRNAGIFEIFPHLFDNSHRAGFFIDGIAIQQQFNISFVQAKAVADGGPQPDMQPDQFTSAERFDFLFITVRQYEDQAFDRIFNGSRITDNEF